MKRIQRTLCLVLALVLLAIVKCLRLKNTPGGLIALPVSIALAIQCAGSFAANLGCILLVTGCTLVSGNVQTVVQMGLIGLMLSAYRQENLPEESTHCAAGIAHKFGGTKRLRWNNGELTISFQKNPV